MTTEGITELSAEVDYFDEMRRVVTSLTETTEKKLKSKMLPKEE